MIAFKKAAELPVVKNRSVEVEALQEPKREAPPLDDAARPESLADQQLRTDTSGKRRRTRETVEINRLL